MTIDVIIPAYNCAKTLGRTLASLAAQTDDDFRVMIIDDCSPEDITGIVKLYKTILKDLRYIRLGENVGVGMARQMGVDSTSGEWMTFVDADDVLMPYAIEVFKIIIENNPDMNMLHSTFLQQVIEDGKHEYLSMSKGYTWMHGKLYRRAFIEKYGIRADPRFTLWADDSFINSQCTELTELTMNELPMYVWTCTAGSITRKDVNSGRDKLGTLMEAMIESGKRVLEHKDNIGHIRNTINNVQTLIKQSGVPMNDRESELFGELCEMYELYGVKPEPIPIVKKKRRLHIGHRAI